MPKGLQGFQPGHPPFHNGIPGHSGGNRTRGKDRAPQSGFQKGHPAFYTGGSVLGHLPTNEQGSEKGLALGRLRSRELQLGFDQAVGSIQQAKGMFKPKTKAKEREVMEALQNGKLPEELSKRYPPGLVQRLNALHDVAVDDTHRDFIKAQMLVREILARKQGNEDDLAAKDARHEVVLLHGNLGPVPLPGTAQATHQENNGSTAPSGVERGVSPTQVGKSDLPGSS